MNCSRCDYSSCPENCASDPFWECVQDECLPKDLSFDQTFDFYLPVIMYLVASIGAMIGIGGGAIIIPLVFIATSFSSDIVVPMVLTGILGTGLIQLVHYCRQGRPERPEYPMINAYFPLVQMPIFSTFSVFGAWLNRISPKWVILLVVILMFSLSAVKTLQKMRHQLADHQHHTEPPPDPQSPSIRCGHRLLVRTILVLLLWYVFLASFLYFREKYDRDQLEYWLWFGGQFLGMMILVLGMNLYLIKSVEDPDYHWTVWKAFRMEGMSAFTGVFAAFVGVGGGIIMVPYMIHEGVSQRVIVATGSIMIPFAAVATIIQFWFLTPRYLYRYGLLMMLCAGLGGLTGLQLLQRYIIKTHRHHLQLLILGVFIIISMILLIVSIVLEF